MAGRQYKGLTDAEVVESRGLHGENVLTPPEKESLLSKFLGSFGDPIIRILLIALVLSFGISIYEFFWGGAGGSVFFEPCGILLAVLLATMVGFVLELRNEKTFQSLNDVNDSTLVKVIRNGNISQVPRRDIVVGDVVLLDTGDEVPADCELLEAYELRMNESSLTGEPQCFKTVDESRFDKDATYPSNHVLKGTTVIEGSCVASVIRVGDATECGKVFEAAQVQEGSATPLSLELDKLAGLITKVSYVLAALIIVGRVAAYFITGAQDGESHTLVETMGYLLNTVMLAVTLIVVAVPEGLPMSITLSLAFSMKKLMKEKTLPRTMHACETMGAASVICTDKTGTLTQNQMRIHETWFTGLAGQKLGDDEVSRRIVEGIAVNTSANLDFTSPERISTIGNPTEGALLLWLHDNGVNYLDVRESRDVVWRLPFTTENKYMATMVRTADGRRVIYLKGAPEIVMGMTDIDPLSRAEVNAALSGYQAKAMRTLGFAFRELADGESFEKDGKLTLTDFEFMGIVAISDPVRLEVPAAIQECISAGIQVKVVTGDTPGTAREIARQISLWTDADTDDEIISGPEFEALSDDEARNRIQSLKIMSRARPNDKERLVRLLRAGGNVVAVTGDGTNDAPALNAADVGLSMGDGTAVAKEASDMTIMDNSFSTITHAVMWGRSLYKNIQRFIMFQMTVNVVACLIVLVGAVIGTESPITVTQMLWVNLIMDTFAALALASPPPSWTVMREKPRKLSASIISKPMACNILGVGAVFFAVLMGMLFFFRSADVSSLAHFEFSEAFDNHLTPYELSIFFTVFVMLQFWNIFNAKAFMTGRSVFHNIADSPLFLTIALVILVGQFVIVQFGYMFFDIVPLALGDWGVILLATSLVLWAGELGRLFKRAA